MELFLIITLAFIIANLGKCVQLVLERTGSLPVDVMYRQIQIKSMLTKSLMNK